MGVIGETIFWKSKKRKERLYPFSAPVVASCLVLAESLSIISIGAISALIMVGWRADVYEYYLFAISFIFICTIMLFSFAGQYQVEAVTKPLDNLDKLLIACLTAFLLFLALAFSLKVSDIFSRKWMYVFAFTSILGLVAIRLVSASVLMHLSRYGILARNVVVLGSELQVERLLQRIVEDKPPFVLVLGIFSETTTNRDEVEGIPVRGGLGDLVEFVRTYDVDDIVIAEPWSEEQRIVQQMEKLLELPTKIYLASDLIGFRYNLRSPEDNFAVLPVSELVEKPLPAWASLLKYLEDKVLAVSLLSVLSPLLLLTAIAVKLDSPGPILFRQERLGFNNRRFAIYKFRSMYHSNVPTHGTPQASADDPRVTRVGRFIRRTSIDELPQLFNVLLGTMSLVGPRPHAIDHNEEYSPQIRGYFARHKVKPGITGWAQAKGFRGETDDVGKMEARVRHDIYYVQNWSLFLDIKILLMTAWIVISGKNAY